MSDENQLVACLIVLFFCSWAVATVKFFSHDIGSALECVGFALLCIAGLYVLSGTSAKTMSA